MSEIELSEDSIRIMMDSRENGEVLSCIPRVQILTLSRVVGEGGLTHYPVKISDGRYVAHGLLSPEFSHLIADGTIGENCIIEVKEYFAYPLIDQGITFVVIHDFDVVDSEQAFFLVGRNLRCGVSRGGSFSCFSCL